MRFDLDGGGQSEPMNLAVTVSRERTGEDKVKTKQRSINVHKGHILLWYVEFKSSLILDIFRF